MMKPLQTESSNTTGMADVSTGSVVCQSRHPGSSETYLGKLSEVKSVLMFNNTAGNGKYSYRNISVF